jgi:hypothetical protein
VQRSTHDTPTTRRHPVTLAHPQVNSTREWTRLELDYPNRQLAGHDGFFEREEQARVSREAQHPLPRRWGPDDERRARVEKFFIERGGKSDGEGVTMP